jgi:cell division protein FtsI (penicillin-binding protein 3)
VIEFPLRRALLMLASVPVCMGALLWRVQWLQTDGAEPIVERTIKQQSTTEVLIARRGSVFDSTGQLLAASILSDIVFIDTQFMVEAYEGRGAMDMERDLGVLGKFIDRDPFELVQLVGDRYPDRFVEIAHDLGPETSQRIRDLKIPGVGLSPVNRRIYPMGSLAAHLLGSVGADGNGVEGVELTANTQLSGKAGSRTSLKDARRNNIGTAADQFTPPQHGKHVVLSIDANIQLIAERELARTVREFKASSGECILLDPHTGDILALANFPTFTPQFASEAPAEMRTNRALVMPYEPGSTIKPFIVAAALDQRLIDLDHTWTLHGPKWQTPYGRTITDVHGYDTLVTWDVLVKSSNIGMSQIVEQMGNPQLEAALRNFGFGSRTRTDLPGDAASAGQLAPVRRWTRASPESLAQGYEMLVTPMQMVRAMAVIANDGRLVDPRLVKGTLLDDGQLSAPKVELETQVVSPATAVQVRRILADVPVRGTAKKARSSRYNLFGKTGTAHRAVNGAYNTTNYTASFVGGAPYENPRLVIAMVIHDPDASQKMHYGGIVAAPAASRVLEQSLQYLGVPESPTLPLPPASIAERLYDFDAKEYEPRVVEAR